MKIQLTVLATTVNSRVLRSGEDKGATKYAVDIYGHTGDYIPSRFVVFGLSSEAEAQAIAAQYPGGSQVLVDYIPREAVYVDAPNLHPVGKK